MVNSERESPKQLLKSGEVGANWEKSSVSGSWLLGRPGQLLRGAVSQGAAGWGLRQSGGQLTRQPSDSGILTHCLKCTKLLPSNFPFRDLS